MSGLDDESKGFLNSIIDTCKDREKNLKAGSIVWRAQNGHSWRPCYQENPDTREEILVDELPDPFSFERMSPLVDSAFEGRANPKGIPCLYVATDKETAMSEVRPWLGAIISIGRFKLARDLKVLDFSVGHGSNNVHPRIISWMS